MTPKKRLRACCWKSDTDFIAGQISSIKLIFNQYLDHFCPDFKWNKWAQLQILNVQSNRYTLCNSWPITKLITAINGNSRKETRKYLFSRYYVKHKYVETTSRKNLLSCCPYNTFILRYWTGCLFWCVVLWPSHPLASLESQVLSSFIRANTITMLHLFLGLKSLVKVSRYHTDGSVFRLHYRVTVMALLAFTFIVTTRQYIGSPIMCVHTKEIPKDVLNTYCWIHPTYTLSSAHWKRVGIDVPHPGVDKTRDDRDKKHVKYYQWVGFCLFFQVRQTPSLYFLLSRAIYHLK